MRRLMGAVAVTLMLGVACAAPAVSASTQSTPASIDQTNTNYRSNITLVSPSVSGVSLRILDYNDELVLTNHSAHTVTVLGYSNEPFARILPDGTVQVNMASPAFYLDQSFYANVTVPSSANPSFAPRWSTVDKTGAYQWHDHRIHWMSPATPPQVKDKAKTTKIFDWRVPLRVDSQPGAVYGNLYWIGRKGGFPLWALISLIVIVPAGLVAAYMVQRRRIAAEHDSEEPATGDDERPVREAW
jgi:hypothetical protein